jgi:hypothetical protein
MVYRYLVAHSDDALSPVELALYRLSSDDILREYELVDFPFHYFFDDRHGVKARFKRQSEQGLEIWIELNGGQRAADDLLAEFLIAWNKMVPGLAVILREKLPRSLE